MLQGHLTKTPLLDALAWAPLTQSSGSLRVVGDRSSGFVYLKDGQIYFVTVDGDRPTVADAERAGIPRAVWMAARTSPVANIRFSEALLEFGATPDAVRTFARHQIIDLLSWLVAETSGSFTPTADNHPFGSFFSFDVSDITQAVRVRLASATSPLKTDSLLSLRPTHATNAVVLRGEDWNSLVALVEPLSLTEIQARIGATSTGRFGKFLEERGLVSIVEHEEQDDHSPSTVADMRSPRSEELLPASEGSRAAPAEENDMFGVDIPEANTTAVDEPTTHQVTTTEDTSSEDQAPHDPNLEDSRPPHNPRKPDGDTADAERPGREAYAMVAGLRAAHRDSGPQLKASTLRRVIDAVRRL